MKEFWETSVPFKKWHKKIFQNIKPLDKMKKKMIFLIEKDQHEQILFLYEDFMTLKGVHHIPPAIHKEGDNIQNEQDLCDVPLLHYLLFLVITIAINFQIFFLLLPHLPVIIKSRIFKQN